MSQADAEAYIASVEQTQQDVEELGEYNDNLLTTDDIIVFVDFHEDRARHGPSFVEALRTVEVRRPCWRVIQCHLHTGDVIICRVQARSDESTAAAAAACVDETIRINSNQPVSTLLRSPSTELVAVLIYERKTVTDLVASIRSTQSYARQNHLQSEISRQLEFARRTGARPRMLLEGYLTYGIERRPIGAMHEDGLHSIVQRLDLVDGVATVQTMDVYDSARTCLKDARFISEKNVQAGGWLRLGTGENRDQVISVRKLSNYDVTAWYRGTLQSIPGMSSERARLVVTRYPNVRTLLAAYDACEDAEHRRQMMADLRVESGHRRRLGPTLADRIEARFYAEPVDESARPPQRQAAKRARKGL